MSLSMKKKIIAVVGALGLSAGALTVGITAANAAQYPGCSVVAGVPARQSGGTIGGSGSASCSSSAQRTFIYQVHRRDWWNPNIAQTQDVGNKTRYSTYASNCDAGSGSGGWKYYGQAFFSGYDAVFSGDTNNLVICG